MKTSGLLFILFKAVVLIHFWVTKKTVDSVELLAPEEVSGTFGGSVTIQCQYSFGFKDHTKYWCRGPVYYFCKIEVKTPRNRVNDRIFITDTKEAGVFTVTMTQLTQSDEDVYWCVIATSGTNIYKSVRVSISNTVITPPMRTVSSSSLILTEGETCWWETLRWILLFVMLGCLALTHITVWRKRKTRNTQPVI
ncbi:unnamed protein product [Menidia menidia]|uniref:(Atlantic silverside) hypothetical protein n=1 Tax=Menidia menidia TaxID=238744 RepID=A0A8S4BZB9_9TELE|nr:unnamed protein product [Menidia menidia]